MLHKKQKIARDLLSNLREEVQAFEELRTVLEEERIALVELDVPGIHRCTVTKQRIATQHHQLEDERRRFADRFFLLDRKLKPGSRLSEVAKAAKAAGVDPDGDLQQVRERLSCLMDNVAEMNRLNERFVAHSLVVVGGALSMMRRVAGHVVSEPPSTYAASGRLHSDDEAPKKTGGLQATG